MTNNEERTTSSRPKAGPPAIWPFNILFGPALLALAIVIATLATDRSYASYLSVRLAPSATLSNGAQVLLGTTLDDAGADLRQATYVLHVPRGISLAGISYDDRGAIETLRVVDDLTAHTYGVSVTLSTGAPAVAMTASLQVRGVPCPASPVTQTGVTGTAVRVVVRCS